MTSLNEQVYAIRSREDLISFVRALHRNLEESPDEWENIDLGSYLDALAAWIEDMDGYYQNRGEPVPEQPNWMVLGHILLAAKVYE
jgi:hypothetical protein